MYFLVYIQSLKPVIHALKCWALSNSFNCCRVHEKCVKSNVLASMACTVICVHMYVYLWNILVKSVNSEFFVRAKIPVIYGGVFGGSSGCLSWPRSCLCYIIFLEIYWGFLIISGIWYKLCSQAAAVPLMKCTENICYFEKYIKLFVS